MFDLVFVYKKEIHKSKRHKFKDSRDEIKNRGLISPLTA
jgi:hypothetical protein